MQSMRTVSLLQYIILKRLFICTFTAQKTQNLITAYPQTICQQGFSYAYFFVVFGLGNYQ